MKYILLLLLFVNHSNAQSDFKDLRKVFILSTDSYLKCTQLNEMTIDKVTISPIYHSYNIVSKILQSKHLRNPVKKIKVFKENTKRLDSLLVFHPNILEIRFLRYSIQSNAPKILGYTNFVNDDYDFIMQNILNADEELKKFILPVMSKLKNS